MFLAKRKRVNVKCQFVFARFLMRSCERKKSPCQMSLKLYQNPKMTIEFDVEVVRKNNHLKRLFACRLKLHATSEFRKSWRAEPGVTRQITLSGFIPSAIFSVERICARGNRASRQRQARQPTRQPSQPPKASEAAHAQHSGNTKTFCFFSSVFSVAGGFLE